MSLNLPKIVLDFLSSKPDEKFTARQIAEWIFNSYPDECREKQQRSKATKIPLNTDSALIQQIVAEIGAQRLGIQKKSSQIKTTEGRPRKYYFTDKSDDLEIAQIETIQTEIWNSKSASSNPLTEHDLYPKLSEFLWAEFNIFSKRINEKKASNQKGSGGNHWLYPDLVGLEDLSREWHQEIKLCVNEIADRKSRLWSFEVKKLINRSNVREVYFQSVSNSSWANYGYLVAAEIQGVETMKELRMLSGLHGIGLIELDSDNPADSRIAIPARERNDIDWNVANRLAEENSDFLKAVKLVRQFHQTGEHHPTEWDISDLS